MICPHCRIAFSDNASDDALRGDASCFSDGPWRIRSRFCAECKRLILDLVSLKIDIGRPIVETQAYRVWPKGTSRAPCSLEVPEDIAEDYREACLVLADSPKAAAALARRCLQHVLRDAAKVKCPTLAKEIDAVLESKSLPTHIAENIDAIRHTGNFAAHPEWYEHTGQIVPVEPGEADWTLDVLEGLFDFYYVQPAKSKARRQALDQKLAQAGKSPMKQPQAPGAPPAAQKAPPAGTP